MTHAVLILPEALDHIDVPVGLANNQGSLSHKAHGNNVGSLDAHRSHLNEARLLVKDD